MYRDSWGMVGQFVVLQVASFALYFLFALFPGILSNNDVMVQMVVSFILNVGVWFLFFAMGRQKGCKDLMYTKAISSYREKFPDKPLSPQEQDKCFRPSKGFLTAYMSCLPALLVSILAVTTASAEAFEGLDVTTMGVVANLVNAQYSFFFGVSGLNLLPALHPLLPLINPLFAGLGYLAGRKRFAILEKAIEMSYKEYRKKQRRERRRKKREEEQRRKQG